jgi:hypothetical protein
MSPAMPTTERVALALEAINAPVHMIAAARAGRYDDFKSQSATPIGDLVSDLWDLKTPAAQALSERAAGGEFDATREEADDWYRRQGWQNEDWQDVS